MSHRNLSLIITNSKSIKELQKSLENEIRDRQVLETLGAVNPLENALYNNKNVAVKYYLERTDEKLTENTIEKVLNYVAKYGDLEILTLLFQREELVGQRPKTSLQDEVVEKTFQYLEHLIGYDNARNIVNHIEVLKFAIEKGVDIHINNDMLLRYAAMYSLETLRFLLENKKFSEASLHYVYCTAKYEQADDKALNLISLYYKPEPARCIIS